MNIAKSRTPCTVLTMHSVPSTVCGGWLIFGAFYVRLAVLWVGKMYLDSWFVNWLKQRGVSKTELPPPTPGCCANAATAPRRYNAYTAPSRAPSSLRSHQHPAQPPDRPAGS